MSELSSGERLAEAVAGAPDPAQVSLDLPVTLPQHLLLLDLG